MADERRVYILLVNDLEGEDQNSTVIIGEIKKSEREREHFGVAHLPSNTDPTSFSITMDEPLISSNSRSLHATILSTNHVLPPYSACLSRPDTPSIQHREICFAKVLAA